MKIKLIQIFIFLISYISYTQNFQTVEEVNYECAQLGFATNEEAEITVDRILDEIGVFRNFVLQECPNINNAIAKNIESSSGEKIRYILYDNEFFENINNKASNDWAAISILAHEIAHHLNGHALNNKGSNHRFELEADFSSGFYLAKMGATLEEAQSAIQTLRYEKATHTHPAKVDRLREIEKGWLKASGNKKKIIEEPKVKIIKKIDLYDVDEKLSSDYFKKGNEEYERKNYSASAEYFLKSYQYGGKKELGSLYFSAYISFFAGNYIESLKRYEVLLDNGYNENLKDVYKFIALNHLNMEDNYKALKAFSKANEYNTDDYDLIIYEANLYFKLGNNVKFREKLEQALKLKPYDPKLHYNLGVLHLEVDNYERAEQYFKKSIELKPNDNTDAYTNLVVTILSGEDYLIERMNGLGISPEENKEYDKLALERIELYKRVKPYLEYILVEAPNNVEIRNTLNNVNKVINKSKK
ncbi:tetratricopeptide repeat protein [Urechidicola croceus]|uniref:Uncharacterized protein n=1 Tax=Urechidicola croceus TaxID=1850246 RepID=A0A1D8P6Y8_9FLAO|nr:tetratricopeptide repeat protein [Urechidicola croceus]AOW20331.1 hypothetical protein LPB138_06400 [Urechidicola croceus]